jgi:hypothetical protein
MYSWDRSEAQPGEARSPGWRGAQRMGLGTVAYRITVEVRGATFGFSVFLLHPDIELQLVQYLLYLVSQEASLHVDRWLFFLPNTLLTMPL